MTQDTLEDKTKTEVVLCKWQDDDYNENTNAIIVVDSQQANVYHIVSSDDVEGREGRGGEARGNGQWRQPENPVKHSLSDNRTGFVSAVSKSCMQYWLLAVTIHKCPRSDTCKPLSSDCWMQDDAHSKFTGESCVVWY